MRRFGMTLVELLVTIGVVAALLGIALPALMRARGAAESTVCMSRLRGIMQGHALISDSNGGVWANMVPRGQYGAIITIGSTSTVYGTGALVQADWWVGPFVGVLWEDGDTGEVLACPTVYKRDPDLFARAPMEAGSQSYRYSVALLSEARLWDPEDTTVRENATELRKRVPTAGVAFPSAKVAMFERADHHGNGFAAESGRTQRLNAAFCDGHVASADPTTASPGLAYRLYTGWTRIGPRPFSSAAWGYLGHDY
jgi:prepilin-type processing-associated H-X9-DG protein